MAKVGTSNARAFFVVLSVVLTRNQCVLGVRRARGEKQPMSSKSCPDKL